MQFICLDLLLNTLVICENTYAAGHHRFRYGVSVDLRLVEFQDDQGGYVSIAQQCAGACPEDICEVYQHCWMNEPFFKWIKR